MSDTITSVKELIIDISDTETESDPKNKREIYGEGYISINEKASCGKAFCIDVKTAGSFDDLSIRESAIGTRIIIDTICSG